ncbi:MAG: thioredoxin family protein [Bradyrhizobium sp.]
MINRRVIVTAIALAAGLAVSTPALAFESKPFDLKAFEAAQAAGNPILVEVTAPWCPTCKAQKPILSELTQKAKFKELMVFEIDFDTQKNLLRKFNVNMQSTLISYKGAREVGRSTGDTNASSIEAQLDKSI